MRIQFQILLFIFCLNLAATLIITLGLPGTGYVAGGAHGAEGQNYEQQFNASEIVGSWNVYGGGWLIGDIVSALSFFWSRFSLLIDGFPQLLTWMGNTFIMDPAGQAAFAVISWTLRGIFAMLMAIMIIEFIGGRIFTD